MNKQIIDDRTARNIIIRSQLTNTISQGSSGENAVASIVEKLGYVQIDTISVINRAHHHTLWIRMPQYQIQDLHKAQKEQKSIFEYWGHAMSYLPMTDYRFSLPYKKRLNSPYGKWIKSRLEKCGDIMEPTFQRIRKEGPLASRDFASEGEHRGTWWDWRPVKMALELLFWQGRLMVAERKNFQKIYDLPERVLPDWVDTAMPTDEELGRFLVLRALKAYGIANEREIGDYLRVAEKRVIVQALQDMCSAHEVLPVLVKVNGKELDYYLLPETLELGEKVLNKNDRVFIFSPFDNFCIQRERIKTFFNFDYALECYLKPEQRKFGYFAIPLFWKDRFIGRIDAKADRKAKMLIIHHLKFEAGVQPEDALKARLQEQLIAFTKFQNCQRYIIEKITPVKFKKMIPLKAEI